MNRPRSKPKPEGERAASHPEIRRTALDLLARREHARRELDRKLVARGYDADAVAAVLDGLARDGLLSDARYVEEYVRSRVARGFGPQRIGAELRERGVAGAVIADALQVYAGQWRGQIAAVRSKRFGAGMPADFRERARQMRFLQQRGFGPELIRGVFTDMDDDSA